MDRQNKLRTQIKPATLLYQDVKKVPSIFTDEQIEKIFETLEHNTSFKGLYGLWMTARNKVIVYFLHSLMLRPNEACSLRFDDINTQDKTLYINGENNKQKKDRVLPLTDSCLNVLEEYFKFPTYLWRGSAYLFPSFEHPEKPLSAGRWKHIFREKILKPAGIWVKPEGSSNIPKYRSYTLRSTGASKLLDESKDIYLVANTLGHSDLRSSKPYIVLSKEYNSYMKDALNHKIDVVKERIIEKKVTNIQNNIVNNNLIVNFIKQQEEINESLKTIMSKIIDKGNARKIV